MENGNISKINMTRRILIFVASIIALALFFLTIYSFATGAFFSNRITSQKIITVFEGKIPYETYRRAHAKGICFSGNFISNGNAEVLSKASVFKSGSTKIFGRFAAGGINPHVSDNTRYTKSIAISFNAEDGQVWRMANLAAPVAPHKTVEAFYLGKPPSPKQKINWVISSGFNNETYNSINSFKFTNKKGNTVYARWSIIPADHFTPLGDEKIGDNELFDNIYKEGNKRNIVYSLVLIVGTDEDDVNDPTIAWPDNHEKINAGNIIIDKVYPIGTGQCIGVTFDPLTLPNGIAPSEDPILAARSGSYSDSLKRRATEIFLKNERK